MNAKTWWNGMPRWSLCYGRFEGLEAYAIRELQRFAQHQAPYVMDMIPVGGMAGAGQHQLLVGTPVSHPRIAALADQGAIRIPEQPGGYALAGLADPADEKRELRVVAGRDPEGVRNGVMDFNARFASEFSDAFRYGDPRHRIAAWNVPVRFTATDWPRVQDRGLWTWGYVIYDYRRYLDHMARLRLNMLTIWNSCAPLNAAAIVEYARERGIRIVWGFHWGWGARSLEDLATPEGRAELKADILRRYREQYLPLKPQGIYFQTVTEHHTRQLGGRSVAAVTCDLVNDVARALLEMEPELQIQFGLHATSIREDYRDLAALDPRVTITWEDAGGIPYTYEVTPEVKAGEQTIGFEETLAYSKELAAFRPGAPFAIVPKGYMHLNWNEEFEDHGPFLLGERSAATARERLALVQSRWALREQRWLQHHPLAARFWREIVACKPASILATALVEDGGFEEEVQRSVSLFAQTVFNPERAPAEILAAAAHRYWLRGDC